MSIKDLYSSGFVARNQGHFAAIVRVALSDGEIVKEEQLFLQRLADKLNIGEIAYAEILEDPTNYPINPPNTYNRRLERLFDLVRIVYVDLDIKNKQIVMLERIGIGLGFAPANVEFIIQKALQLIRDGVLDVDTFSEEIKNMNR
ncbi:MAG: TerB family tellurite resistance protein [Flavobacteriaceae bacterium]|nr:TerB family tellurite resistance protein [Flavobacteriaceae bacterium]